MREYIIYIACGKILVINKLRCLFYQLRLNNIYNRQLSVNKKNRKKVGTAFVRTGRYG